MILYHGNDHILSKPLYGFGKSDNDYGVGFYTTLDLRCPAKELAKLFSPLHEASILNTAEKLDCKFF